MLDYSKPITDDFRATYETKLTNGSWAYAVYAMPNGDGTQNVSLWNYQNKTFDFWYHSGNGGSVSHSGHSWSMFETHYDATERSMFVGSDDQRP